jgi:hypothetical protein
MNKTGKNAAHKADRSNHENCDCLRAITKATPTITQSTGATVRINIQNKGIEDHVSLETLVAYHSQTPINQAAEQISMTNESTDVGTGLRFKVRISA